MSDHTSDATRDEAPAGPAHGVGKTAGLPGDNADPRTHQMDPDVLDDTAPPGDVATDAVLEDVDAIVEAPPDAPDSPGTR